MIQEGLNKVQENLSYNGSKLLEELKYGINKNKDKFMESIMFYEILLENYRIKYLLTFTFSGTYPLISNTDYYAIIDGIELYLGQLIFTYPDAEAHKEAFIDMLSNHFLVEEEFAYTNTSNLHFYCINNLGTFSFNYYLVEIKESFEVLDDDLENKTIINYLIKTIN